MSHKTLTRNSAIRLGLPDPAGDSLLGDREELSVSEILRMDIPLESVMELLRYRRYTVSYFSLGRTLDSAALHCVTDPQCIPSTR